MVASSLAFPYSISLVSSHFSRRRQINQLLQATGQCAPGSHYRGNCSTSPWSFAPLWLVVLCFSCLLVVAISWAGRTDLWSDCEVQEIPHESQSSCSTHHWRSQLQGAVGCHCQGGKLQSPLHISWFNRTALQDSLPFHLRVELAHSCRLIAFPHAALLQIRPLEAMQGHYRLMLTGTTCLSQFLFLFFTITGQHCRPATIAGSLGPCLYIWFQWGRWWSLWHCDKSIRLPHVSTHHHHGDVSCLRCGLNSFRGKCWFPLLLFEKSRTIPLLLSWSLGCPSSHRTPEGLMRSAKSSLRLASRPLKLRAHHGCHVHRIMLVLPLPKMADGHVSLFFLRDPLSGSVWPMFGWGGAGYSVTKIRYRPMN